MWSRICRYRGKNGDIHVSGTCLCVFSLTARTTHSISPRKTSHRCLLSKICLSVTTHTTQTTHLAKTHFNHNTLHGACTRKCVFSVTTHTTQTTQSAKLLPTTQTMLDCVRTTPCPTTRRPYLQLKVHTHKKTFLCLLCIHIKKRFYVCYTHHT